MRTRRRTRWRRRSLFAFAATGATATALQVGAIYAFDAGSHESQLFADVNQDRTSNGVAALTYNTTLASLARDGNFSTCGPTYRGRSQDMVDRNYFDHVILNCGGRYVFDVMTDLHIYYQEAGENIGWTTASDATSAQDIETRFMNSPEHRANILNANFTQIGIGAAPGTSADTCCDGSAMTMYTQIFLEPPAAPTPRPQPSHSTQPVAGASALPSVPRRNSPVPAVQISPATQPSPNVPVPSPSPSPSPTPGIELQGPAQGVTGTAQNAGLVELIVENVLRAFLNL